MKNRWEEKNQMKKKVLAASCGVLMCLSLGQMALADHGHDRGDDDDFFARMTSSQEFPAASSAAKGTFKLKVVNATTLEYELTYSGLEGTITQAHIHFAQPGISGGIMIWLCGTAALPGPAGTPVCKGNGETLTGTITAATVIGPAAQGINVAGDTAASNFDRALRAIRNGQSYANIHSTRIGSGEIRGNIKDRDRD
jgi:CHRD domain